MHFNVTIVENTDCFVAAVQEYSEYYAPCNLLQHNDCDSLEFAVTSILQMTRDVGGACCAWAGSCNDNSQH